MARARVTAFVRVPGERDRGESLVELLVAVMLMGVAVVAVVGGLVVAITMSGVHRDQATAGATSRDYAESVQAWVAAGHYDAGAAPDYRPARVGYTPPAGVTANQYAVRCWAGTTWRACGGTDTGLQQVTIEVYSVDGATCAQARTCARLEVVVRRPCRITDEPCG